MKRSRPADLDADKLEDIVGRIRAGDSEAFAEFYRTFWNPLHYKLWRMNVPDPDDTAQEVFFATFRAIVTGTLRDPAALPAFLLETGRRIGYGAIRRLIEARKTVQLPHDDLLPNDESTEEEEGQQRTERLALVIEDICEPPLVEEQGRTECVARALGEMNALDREILRRFYLRVEGREHVMREMCIDATQFRLRKSRALGKLKTAMRKRASKLELECQTRRLAWRETTHREDHP